MPMGCQRGNNFAAGRGSFGSVIRLIVPPFSRRHRAPRKQQDHAESRVVLDLSTCNLQLNSTCETLEFFLYKTVLESFSRGRVMVLSSIHQQVPMVKRVR